MYKNTVADRNVKDSNVTRIFGLLVLCGIAAVVVVSILGWSRQTSLTTASHFVHEATIGNKFEIESSQLALSKSQNDTIRQFAQHMVDDHGKAAAELGTVVSTVPNITAEAPEARLDNERQAMLDKLNGATGQDFDRLYVKDQVKAHNDAVDMFRDYGSEGENQSLKDFASRTLPTLQSHKHDIDAIQASFFSH